MTPLEIDNNSTLNSSTSEAFFNAMHDTTTSMIKAQAAIGNLLPELSERASRWYIVDFTLRSSPIDRALGLYRNS